MRHLESAVSAINPISLQQYALRLVVLVSGGLCLAAASSAQGLIYVDAIGGGVPGGDNLAPASAIRNFQAAAHDDLWGTRSVGSGSALFTAGDGDGSVPTPDPPDFDENVPEITQTLSGLQSGVSYDIYVAYWSAINADWGVRAGLSSNPGGNPWYNRTGEAVDTVTSIAGGFGGAAYFQTPPQANSDEGLFVEGNRQMYLARVGSATASGSGQVVVYLDDLSTQEFEVGDFNRTWFDGLAYVPNGGGEIDVLVNATIDRATGGFSIDFTNPNGPDVVSYAITSASGSLNPAGWNSIATGSNSSLDPGDTWTASSSDTELTESETGGSGGFSLDMDIDFGSLWRDSPFNDVSLVLTLADATEFVIPINYAGDAFAFGDLTFDGVIDTADFQVVVDNLLKPIDTATNDTELEQYKLGDLTGDAAVTYDDVIAFRQIFAGLTTGESAESLTVPEPVSLCGVALIALMYWLFSPRRRSSLLAATVGFAAIGCVLTPNTAVAQSSAPLHQFDVDGSSAQSGPTLTGWTQVLEGLTAIDGSNVSLTLAGPNLATRGRNRGTAPTMLGGDNNDNAVPEGEFAALYQDLLFVGSNEVISATFTGLLPDTVYDVTAWSYDSGAFSGTAVQQDFLVGSTLVAELDYEGDLASGPGPDPDTSALNDYSVAFQITTDSSGGAIFTTVSDGSQGARLNGVRLAIPSAPLTLEIDRVSGLVTIKNPTDFDISLDYYELRSESGSLNAESWLSLDDQDPEPDPFDSGWNEAGGSDEFVLAEVRGLEEGATTIGASGGSLTLGSAFLTSGTEDLTFAYGLNNGNLVMANVQFVDGSGALLGDHNGDKVVDAIDYAVWRENLGQSVTLPGEDPNVTPGQVTSEDFAVWRSNYGQSGSPTAVSTPEPGAVFLLAAALWAPLALRFGYLRASAG